MKEYTFRVTQPLVGFYEGEIVIEAESEEEAKKLILSYTQKELDNMADWTISDNFDSDGDIEIHNINEL